MVKNLKKLTLCSIIISRVFKVDSFFFEIGIIIQLFILPLAILGWQYFSKSSSKLEWFLKSAGTLLFLIAAYRLFLWPGLSHYLRAAYFLIFIPGLFPTWYRVKGKPIWKSPSGAGQWVNFGFAVVLTVVSAWFWGNVLHGSTVPQHAVNLAFPLRNGDYYIGQGGGNRLLNAHLKVHRSDLPAWRGQMWGIDIVKLNPWGNRADGLYPNHVSRYAVWGDSVYAPCSGRVIATQNDIPDLNPPAKDPVNKAGNYVLIECDEGFVVLLAHLQQGSVVTPVGSKVNTDTRLGRVGNSGNSTEPHLHISAQWRVGTPMIFDADPLPILFNGHFLVRNNVIENFQGQEATL